MIILKLYSWFGKAEDLNAKIRRWKKDARRNRAGAAACVPVPNPRWACVTEPGYGTLTSPKPGDQGGAHLGVTLTLA